MGFLLQKAEPRHAVLYGLIVGMSLRRSEALGRGVEHLSNDCSTVTLCQQRIKDGGVKATLKTDAATRTVNFHPDLAKMLRAFVGNRTEGYVFHPTKVGCQDKEKGIDPIFVTVDPGNLQRDSLDELMVKLGRGQAAGECRRRVQHASGSARVS